MRRVAFIAGLFTLLCVGLLAVVFGIGSPPQKLASAGPRIEATLTVTWETNGPARQITFSHDGSMLATSDVSGRISIRHVSSWRELAELHHDGGATSIAFSPDGSKLFSGGYDGQVRIWNTQRHSQIGQLNGGQRTLWALDLSPDGTQLAAAGEDGLVRIWRLDNPTAPLVLRGHELNIWGVRYSPDGKLLASSSFDKTARIWDSKTGKIVRIIRGHEQAVVGVAFGPDGRTLATCGDDSTIRLWRISDGKPLRTIDAGNHTYKVDFSPDGQWLASGGRARSGIGTAWHQLTGLGGAAAPVRIWRMVDGALAATLPANDDVPEVRFSPDQRWLATSGEDNRVRIWRLRSTSS